MDTITSADGTRIAFKRLGSGPPLVLVYGNGDVHDFWDVAGVSTTLARNCTVYVVERRGRGESGDSSEYALEREAEDVAAVVDTIAEPATLLGHSGGALYALEASVRTDDLNGLILYEPVFPVGDHDLPPDEVFFEMEDRLADGEDEGVLLMFLRDVAGLTSDEISELQAAPFWQDMVDAAHALPRELRAIAAYDFRPSRFAEMTAPTLLLSGSESPELFKAATKAVAEAVPNGQVEVFDGQEHMAMLTAPDRFVSKVAAFTCGPN